MRRTGVLVSLVLVLLAVAWLARDAVLSAIGDRLVSEDNVVPTDWVVLSGAAAPLTALEGMYLYRESAARRLVVIGWKEDAAHHLLRQLGVSYRSASELIQEVLERGGVPPEAVTIVPARVDGTESEIRALAGFVEKEHIRNFAYVTTRTHTARARYLLARQIPSESRALVRASRLDPYTTTGWWKDRELARDVMSEYLRWVNTLVLQDFWQADEAYAVR